MSRNAAGYFLAVELGYMPPSGCLAKNGVLITAQTCVTDFIPACTAAL